MSSAVAWGQPQLPFFDPVEPRSLPQDGEALFTLNWLSPAGKLNRQWAFQVDELETMLRLTAGQQNLFMSQCFFDCPVRRSPFVAYATHAYVDLDTYRVPTLAAKSRHDLALDIRAYCNDTGMPPPSAIISSGRGIYGKWYWAQPIGRADVGRLIAVNRALVRRLNCFGADPKATDATRILRVTGSQHTGAQRPVSLLHLEQCDGHVIAYDFDAFVRDIAPSTDALPADSQRTVSVADRERKARTQGGCVFTREGWHWAIVEDCRTLARMRWGGIVATGWRDIFGHIVACQLARIFDPGNLLHEIIAHARLMLPSDYVKHDLAGHCTSLMARAKNGAGYRYSKARMIEVLQITPTEERQMAALISDAEKGRRENNRQQEQRRAAGMIVRADYEAAAAARRPMVVELRARGLSWRKTGAALGVSEGEARRLALPGVRRV